MPTHAQAARLFTGEDTPPWLERCTRRLIALVRVRLDARLKPKLDPEEIVQSVFRTLLRRASEGAIHATDEATLWSLLVQIAVRKCYRKADHFFADRRDVRRETSLAESPTPHADPGIDEEVAVLDLLDQLRSRLDSARKRQVLDLTLQGYTVAEISDRINFYERGVERIRAELRQRLQELL